MLLGITKVSQWILSRDVDFYGMDQRSLHGCIVLYDFQLSQKAVQWEGIFLESSVKHVWIYWFHS